MTTSDSIEIGVVSDTHGLLRPSVAAALAGVRQIIHAGDLGQPRVLEALEALAPVAAVRGNVDHGSWAQVLPYTRVVPVGEVLIYVLHDLAALDLDPAAAGFTAVISGHSHRPRLEHRRGVLYLNPGAAGPRRFDLPISLARLRVHGTRVDAQLIELKEEG